MSQPKLGESVTVEVPPFTNNGEPLAAALVTRVVETEDDARVNVTIFLDTGSSRRLTNVKVVDKEPSDKVKGEAADGGYNLAWRK